MSVCSPPAEGPARRASVPSATHLHQRFLVVRQATEALVAPCEVEDLVVSSMPDVSPAKWHLAHTTWFFETFLLQPHVPGYQPFDARFAYLFNSYYVQAGERHCRAQRGLATRPPVREVLAYRAHVDAAVARLLETEVPSAVRAIVELGLQHEQQHQELLLMDLKHVYWTNPLRPAYAAARPRSNRTAPPLRWLHVDADLRVIGAAPGERFTYDNESPTHRVFQEGFAVASRLVTNGDFLAFMADGGYLRPLLWLSDGWNAVREHGWRAPLYWEETDGGWTEFTLHGTEPLDPDAPVCHVSYYEADAFARWAGARLPAEHEWEVAARVHASGPHERFGLHPAIGREPGDPMLDAFGAVWQFTRSAYLPYPGFRAATGAIGEYNGKFMCDQWVLRGSACITPDGHARTTYRNFFPAAARWQFGGIRLGRDA